MNEPIGTRTTPRATFSTTGPTAIGMMSCAGVPAWQTRVAYTGGQKVAYKLVSALWHIHDSLWLIAPLSAAISGQPSGGVRTMSHAVNLIHLD